MNALDFLLKANLYGLLFVGCYHLLLRRHTFFGLNRAYLLVSAVLSLGLPLASLPTDTAETLAVPAGVLTFPTATLAAEPVASNSSLFEPDWEQMALLAYGLVAAALLTRLWLRTFRLLRLIHRSPRQVRANHVLVQPNDPATPTFSFLQYVVLNPADATNTLIIRHELVHIEQGHSVDVLGLAVLRAMFWACPTLWLIDRALRQVHEFLADRVASVQDALPSTGYAQFLIEYTFGVRPDALTNGFFSPSLLKQRIRMLHQRATSRWALGKYALILPLALGLLAMTTARKEITAVMTPTTDNTIMVSGRVVSASDGKPLLGATVTAKGTNQGAKTNSEGQYRITVPADGLLVFSFIGFTTQEVRISERTLINVSLARLTTKLNDVVVVAYEPDSAGYVLRITTAAKPTDAISRTSSVFTSVEQQPEFPGGMAALSHYLSKNLRYPSDAQQNKVQGNVFVQFVVSDQGQIQQLRVLKGIGTGCDEEAVRVVSQMPQWNPGRQNGKLVAVQYVLPIEFVLETREGKRVGQAEPTFKPLGSPTGDFPTIRSTNFPHQPQLRAITIRGTGPLGNLSGDPLYIIDGKETPADSAKSLISPDKIESVTVLKEEASTVRYGEKGKNGVVIITTKKP